MNAQSNNAQIYILNGSLDSVQKYTDLIYLILGVIARILRKWFKESSRLEIILTLLL